MKKRLLLPACLVSITLLSQAQTTEPKAPPPPPEPPKIEMVKFNPPMIVKDGEGQDFFRKNPSVKGTNRTGDDVIVLLKDKTTEKYNLADEKEKKAFTDKFGSLPVLPPPPPPPTRPPKVRRTTVI